MAVVEVVAFQVAALRVGEVHLVVVEGNFEQDVNAHMKNVMRFVLSIFLVNKFSTNFQIVTFLFTN